MNNVTNIKSTLMVKAESATKAALIALTANIREDLKADIEDNMFEVHGEAGVFVSYCEGNLDCPYFAFTMDFGNGNYQVNVGYRSLEAGEFEVLTAGEQALEIISESGNLFFNDDLFGKVINEAEYKKACAYHGADDEGQHYLSRRCKPVVRKNGKWVIKGE